jgi:hypothetical protein
LTMTKLSAMRNTVRFSRYVRFKCQLSRLPARFKS